MEHPHAALGLQLGLAPFWIHAVLETEAKTRILRGVRESCPLAWHPSSQPQRLHWDQWNVLVWKIPLVWLQPRLAAPGSRSPSANCLAEVYPHQTSGFPPAAFELEGAQPGVRVPGDAPG